MMQTGRLFTGGIEHPHVGCVARRTSRAAAATRPPHVLLPRPIGRTGGNMPHGQTAGYLGKTYDPFVLNADPNAKDFKVPDLLPPDYVTAVREPRRQTLRDGDRRRGRARSRRRPTPGCSTPTSSRPTG